MDNEPIASGLGSIVINLPSSPAAATLAASAAVDKLTAADDVMQPKPGIEDHGDGTDSLSSSRSVSGDSSSNSSCPPVSAVSPQVTDIEKIPKADVPSTNGAPPSTRQPALVDVNGKATFYELTRCMFRLYSNDLGRLPVADSEIADALVSDLEYVQRCVELGSCSRSDSLVNRLVSLGVVELCQQLCRTLFQHPQLFSSTSPFVRRLTTLTLGIVTTLTDGSKDSCQRVLEVEFQKDLFAYLRSDSLDPAKVKFNEWRGYIADCFLALLYNVIQVVTEARELYRDEDSVRVFQRFRTNTTKSIASMALILQAYVINEDENVVILGSDSSCFKFLADELNSTFEDLDEHRSTNGYRAVELVTAINKLAVADANKPPIVESGVVDSYLRLIRGGQAGNVDKRAAAGDGVLQWVSYFDEQLAASTGLWTLALSCADKLREHATFVEDLKALLKTNPDDRIKRQADGALLALGASAKNVPTLRLDVTAASNDAQKNVESTFHGAVAYGDQIFISYNHASKATVQRIRDRLKSAGFYCWFDNEAVFESIADDIIKGLDRASVVLACMTQKYYESPYCKKEVVYAAESYKKIIPLTLEPRYNPHGWLRFHACDGLRYDFSSDENFEESFKKLTQTLKIVISNLTEKTPDAGKPVDLSHSSIPPLMPDAPSPRKSTPPPVSTETTKSVKGWTSKEVLNWLHSNGLGHLADWFQGFDGEMLIEYRAFRHGAPETQAACYQDERVQGKMSVSDVIKLSRALRQLGL